MAQLKPDSKKPTEEQEETRIDYAVELLSRRYHKSQMKAAMRAFVDKQMAEVYGAGRTILTARTIETYLSRAKARMAALRKEHLNESYEKSVSLYESIIRDPKTTTRERIRAQERLDIITGIESPMRFMQVADPENKAPRGAIEALEQAYGKDIEKSEDKNKGKGKN